MCTKTDIGIFLQTPCWLMNSGYNDVIVAAWKNENSSPGNLVSKFCIRLPRVPLQSFPRFAKVCKMLNIVSAARPSSCSGFSSSWRTSLICHAYATCDLHFVLYTLFKLKCWRGTCKMIKTASKQSWGMPCKQAPKSENREVSIEGKEVALKTTTYLKHSQVRMCASFQVVVATPLACVSPVSAVQS